MRLLRFKRLRPKNIGYHGEYKCLLSAAIVEISNVDISSVFTINSKYIDFLFPEYLVSILINKFYRIKALLFFVLLSSFLLFLIFLYNLGSHCDKDGFNSRRKENSNGYILKRSKIYRRNFTRN